MTRTAVFAAFAMALAAAGFAQNGPDNDPDVAPGYVKSIFDHEQIDSVNLYNGQLTIPIPLGPIYPIGPKLKFQMLMNYNSVVDNFGKPFLQQQEIDFLYKQLAGNPSLGIGWSLNLGAIKDCQQGVLFKKCYYAPDGSQHMFNISEANGSVTGDATPLFLKGSGPYDMWDGDGNHYEFATTGHVTGYNGNITDFGDGRDGWYLTKLTDPWGNSYSVTYWTNINPLWTYEPNPTCGSASLIKMVQTSNTGTSWIPKDITLPSGLKVHVNTGSNGQVSSMILSVDFPEFVNGVAATKTWNFSYGATQTYTHDCGFLTTLVANMQELSSITLPSDLAGSPSYQFTYAKGLLTNVVLPTSGSIAYCYAMYHFHHGRAGALQQGCGALDPPGTEDVLPQTSLICTGSQAEIEPPPSLAGPGDCSQDNDLRWIDTEWGVYKRTETVGSAMNVTTYTQFSMPFGEAGTSTSPVEPQSMTIVLYPLTDKNASSDAGRQRAKGILFECSPKIVGIYPSAAHNSVPGDRVGAALEERWFETPPSFSVDTPPYCTGNVNTDQGFCGSKAVRVVQSTYDYDDLVDKEGNRRLQQEKTIHGGSACTSCKYHIMTLTPSTTWESNGRHYDTETHSGTEGGDSKVIATDWAPVNWPGGSSTGATILPSLFNQRTTTQGSSVRDEYFEFDTANGFLKGSFVYDSSYDIAFLNCRYNDGHGNVDKDFTKTFASSSTPSRTYCSGNYPNFPASVGVDGDMFGKDYTYQNGQLLAAGWINGSGTPPFFFKNLTRDSTTGWILSSADTTGGTTTYRYDSLGRLTLADPPADLTTFVCYESPTATTAYKTTSNSSLTCPVASTATGLAYWEHYEYDGLGRSIRQKRLQPSSAVSKRFTLYDGVGNAKFTSEWVTDATSETISANLATACVFSGGNYGTARPSSAPGTYKMCFDPFGRPQQIVGSKHSSLVTVDRNDGSIYSDTKEAVLTYCVNATFVSQQMGTCTSGGLNPVTTTTKDAFGRATSVQEPTFESTSYTYDVNSKLTKVTPPSPQTFRTFTYDANGFLRFESTPEGGSVTYQTIGSLGNVRTELRPGSLTISRTFDFAGRLAEQDAGGSKFVVNCYDGTGNCVDGSANYSGGSGTHGKGRLTRRYGYNWIPTIGPVVDEKFTYDGNNARLSQLDTTVGNGDLGSTTAQSWTYDGLGLVATHNHPRVTGTFSVTNTDSFGVFTKVNANGTDVVKAATYNPAAGIASWTAGNTGTSIVTTIAQDASLLPRPGNISNSLFSTGTYTYDSAGDVLTMGSDKFNYDSRTRLVSAQYGSTTQTFAYDKYGNMTSVAGVSPVTFCTGNPPTCTNNKLPSPWAYDSRGNLITSQTGTELLSFDSIDRQYRDLNNATGTDWTYLHNGAGERLVKFPSNFTVLRREMAREIVEGNIMTRGWTLVNCTGVFSDVGCSDPDARHIETAYQQGITGGCDQGPPLRYCPDNTILRAEMSVFMVKGYKGSTYVPPPCTGIFTDVTCNGTYAQYAPYIEQLYHDAVTVGCKTTPLQFCPGSTIGEWESLVWLAKAPTTPPGNFFWAAYHPVPRGSIYTLRDEHNRVVTEMSDGTTGSSTATLSVGRDNAFLGSLMVASFANSVWTYSASDHLGSPRVFWNASGGLVDSRKYWPYGEDTNPVPPTQRLAFTLMERDTENKHYYDHARHEDYQLARFVSPDKIGGSPGDPRTWNRYAYANGNPEKYVDPNGRLSEPWHIAVTFIAATLNGVPATKAFTLALQTAWVDHRPGFQDADAKHANIHGMAGKLESGRFQTPEESVAGTKESLTSALAKGDTPQALHTAEDSPMVNHAGVPWSGGFSFDADHAAGSIDHIVHDIAPSISELTGALTNALMVMSESQRLADNPQATPDQSKLPSPKPVREPCREHPCM